MRAICAGKLRWLGAASLSFTAAMGCSSSSGDAGGAGDTGSQTDAEHVGGARVADTRAGTGGSSREPVAEESSGGTQASQAASLGQGGAATSVGGVSVLGGSNTSASKGGTLNNSSRATRSSAGGKAPASAANGGAVGGGKSVTSAAIVGGATAGGKSGSGGVSNGGSASGGNPTAGGAVARGGTSSSSSFSKGGATGGGTTPIKVFIAGDSTVQDCSSSCPCGWGSQFDALFNGNVTVVNSAVGGRSVQTWLYDANVSSTMGANGECTLTSTKYNARWTNMTNASTGMKAGDYLFIQFGINDGDSTCPRHVGSALYKGYLAEMAQVAKAAGAQPIFLTPASMIKCTGSTAVGSRGFLTETKEVGAANDVPVIDLHQLSVGLYNQLKLCPDSGDYTSTTSAVGTFFCADHTHFEAAGAARIAKLIAQALKDQNLSLADYLL